MQVSRTEQYNRYELNPANDIALAANEEKRPRAACMAKKLGDRNLQFFGVPLKNFPQKKLRVVRISITLA